MEKGFSPSEATAWVCHMQKPSWCLAVKQTYFMPASFASSTHFSESYSVGLKRSRFAS